VLVSLIAVKSDDSVGRSVFGASHPGIFMFPTLNTATEEHASQV
jgi:hypothetical protein